MIRHIVLIRFRPEVTEAAIAALLDEVRAMQSVVPGILSITAGRSDSPERIERGYHHGFVVDFVDRDALTAYHLHPVHRAVGARLVENATGGLDGILVFDLPVPA